MYSPDVLSYDQNVKKLKPPIFYFCLKNDPRFNEWIDCAVCAAQLFKKRDKKR